MSSTPTHKKALREAVLARRAALAPADRAARSAAIARRAAALEAFARARTVAVYAAIGAEVDPGPLAAAAAAAGKRVAYPRLAADARAMEFAACPPDALVPGRHGTREPPATAPALPPEAVDLVLVPGVAFDAACHRLGRGRGHYDATLAALPAGAFRAGLAFEAQLVDAVPREAHDARLDAIVTEDRVLFPLPSPAPGGIKSPP